jgi:hypothetical protein
MESVKQHDNFPVTISVGHGDSLLPSLLMLPPISPQYTAQKDLSTVLCRNHWPNWRWTLLFCSCSHCVSCIGKENNCSSCSVCWTALWEKPVFYATQWNLAHGLACTASNTSIFCILCLLWPQHASGMNAHVSFRLAVPLQTHVCWAEFQSQKPNTKSTLH